MFTTLLLGGLLAGSYANPGQLVETEWVAEHAGDPDVRVVDMSSGGFDEGHVPGAVYLAPAAIRDAANPPTFLLTPEAFEAMMAGLGISNDTRVVVYDERGGIYAARLWWILNYFGHDNVALMNGGRTKWTAEGRTTSTDASRPPPGRFIARPEPSWVATAADVLAAIDDPSVSILDARTASEIAGNSIRNIKRGGFVPSSTPVYWEDLLDPATRTFKPADELEQIFTDAGVLRSQEVIAYCLVGMRASVDLFALHLIGYEKLRNYYGAWEEWGNRDDLPIATRPK